MIPIANPVSILDMVLLSITWAVAHMMGCPGCYCMGASAADRLRPDRPQESIIDPLVTPDSLYLDPKHMSNNGLSGCV